MKILFFIAVAVLYGCASSPFTNHTTTDKSTFDGSTEVIQEPGFIYSGLETFSGAELKLGLRWSSAAPDDVVILAEVPGDSFASIHGEGGLQFNIDGEVVKLSSAEAGRFETDFIARQLQVKSLKNFPTTMEFITRVASASDVKVKLVTDAGYLEGILTIDRMSSAIRGFREFLVQVEKAK